MIKKYISVLWPLIQMTTLQRGWQGSNLQDLPQLLERSSFLKQEDVRIWGYLSASAEHFNVVQ